MRVPYSLYGTRIEPKCVPSHVHENSGRATAAAGEGVKAFGANKRRSLLNAGAYSKRWISFFAPLVIKYIFDSAIYI